MFQGPFPVVKFVLPNIYYQRKGKVQVTHVNRIKKATVVKKVLEAHVFADSAAAKSRQIVERSSSSGKQFFLGRLGC